MSFSFSYQQVVAYHESTEQLSNLKPLIEDHFFDGVDTVLDIGCGDGKIAALIAKQYPAITVVASDVSATMIAFASKTFSPHEYPNLSFIQKNGCNLGFQERFDRVISFNCLHWIKNQRPVFHQIRTCLKPGGKAFLLAAPPSSEDDLRKVCRKLIFSWKWIFSFLTFRPVHSFHTKKQYERILKKEGFQIKKLQEGKKNIVFENRKSLEQLLMAVLTPLYHLQEERRSEFMDDLFIELSKNGNIDDKNNIHLTIGQTEMLILKPPSAQKTM